MVFGTPSATKAGLFGQGRPPRLTNGRLTARYRTALGRNVPGMTVSRADVAHFMLAALHRPDTIGQTVGIAR